MLTPLFPLKQKRLLNKTILLIIPYILLANNSTVLKKKLKNLLLQRLKTLWLIYLAKGKTWILRLPRKKTIEKVEQMLFDLQKI